MADKDNKISEKKSKGRFYTPQYVVRNILDLSGYYGSQILKKHVIDNSCGDGAFITEIIKRYCKESIDNDEDLCIISKELGIFIHGIESDKNECEKSIINAESIAKSYGIYGVNWDIICADTLGITQYNNKMDYVIGNPPYIRVHNLGNTIEKTKKYTYSQNGMTDLYLVFYEIGLKMLNDTGVLGYITPSSYFNSLAGKYMRNEFVKNNYIDKLVDLKHYQAFSATTYTTITILKKNRAIKSLDYYQFDEKNLIPYYVETLTPKDYFIAGNFYFSQKKNLDLLKKIFFNLGRSDISVKNGYATLCDDVFINDFNFKSKYIIPVIKASRGIKKAIIYPYNENGELISETELQKEKDLYNYLTEKREQLTKRDNEKKEGCFWFSFGRSQAITDTYKNKISINTLLRDVKDLKIINAPKGTGVYSGLYIISNSVSTDDIKEAIASEDFVNYVRLLGKYKSGGYYTFSSRDVKAFLDYKFAYTEGLEYYDK